MNVNEGLTRKTPLWKHLLESKAALVFLVILSFTDINIKFDAPFKHLDNLEQIEKIARFSTREIIRHGLSKAVEDDNK